MVEKSSMNKSKKNNPTIPITDLSTHIKLGIPIIQTTSQAMKNIQT